MAHPQHHKNIRKRLYKHLEPYPNPDAFKRFLDKAIFVVSVLGPVMTIPQVLQIWQNETAAGLSLVSWASYFIFSIFWLCYGIVHKEKPIVISNILALMVQGVIVVGIVTFGSATLS